MDELTLEKLAQEPIYLPGNPYFESLKTFGRDEFISGIINIVATIGASFFGFDDLGKSLSGPIIEKVGFFPAHFKEALEIYKTTPLEKRDHFGYYFKKALKNGLNSLLLDVAIHDPFYIGMMYAGLKASPETPAWLWATGSFVGAVIAAAGVDVAKDELSYFLFKKNLQSKGFEKETYLESRFYISNDAPAQEVLEKFALKFKLDDLVTSQYYDFYFSNRLNEYSGRKPKIRFRKRELPSKKWIQTAQIVYTRASQIEKNKQHQFNYFPQLKEKFYYLFPKGIDSPISVDDIAELSLRNYLKKKTNFELSPKEIFFTRSYVNNPESLFVSADNVSAMGVKRPFYLIEIKSYDDYSLLKEAMRYVMLEFPVVQTTFGKVDLI